MASYQSRHREPLLDSTTQAALEARGKELLGLILVVLGGMAAAMIWSYSPDDPSWMSANDEPVRNWMGRYGAATAAPLMMILGKGIWVVPMVLIAWGVRHVAHWGEDRAVTRLFFMPVAVVMASLYAATLTTGPDWPANFGLGGLFGDTVLGVVLTVIPFGAAFGIKLLSLVLALLTLVLLVFALGFVKEELKTGVRFLYVGTVMTYAMILRLLGRGAQVSARAAQGATASLNARREARMTAPQEPAAPQDDKTRVAAVVRKRAAAAAADSASAGRKMPPVIRADGDDEPPLSATRQPAPAPPAPSGFLSGLLKRSDPMPEPEMVEAPQAPDAEAPDENRITARISDAIRSRAGGIVPPTVTAKRIEPKLTAGRGPRPLILDVRNPQETPAPMDILADDDAVVEDAAFDDGFETVAPQGSPSPAPVLHRRSLPEVETTPLTAEPLFDPDAPSPKPAPRVQTPDAKKVVQHPLKRSTMPSRQALAEAQPNLPLEDKYADYEHPPLNLLTSPEDVTRHHLSDEALEENARMLESVLDDYGVKGEIVSVRPGPVVTMYELEPAPGLKASRVIGLADDIARSMSALSARVSTVPGRSVIGIELPNENREKVVLREILSHRDFGDGNQKLPLALGKDIGGEPIIANLAKMPHLLIAGTTGSGKSVAINTMILSLLYKLTPEECRMIMIDPKMLELSVYDGIPHLLSPVVTDPKKAVVALKWVVGEMEERYRKMSKMGVRNIDGYNSRVADALDRDEMFSRTVQTGFDDETGDPVFETEEFAPEKMPYIVVIVDEMADLMMVAGKEIEACIQRLAQMARASGIHLIMATQRPSVDVITGTIKANFPTRISFQVTSKIDSRTILGEMGAEQLLGMGDMLYMAGGSKITRVHGPFCSDEEVEEIVNFLKGFGPPEYMSGVVDGPDEDNESSIDQVLGLGGNTDGEDALYDQAVAIVIKDRKCSTSYIQRKLAIGYNKAARLVEQMEDENVVSSANHVGKREILVPEQH
ncbi:MAG: DNA translocase FtsK 4TM domain-containing protein [Paracoccaceae bacterium]